MKNRERSRSLVRFAPLLSWIASCLLLSTTLGQQPAATDNARITVATPEEEMAVVKIYHLKHMNSPVLLRVVSHSIPSASFEIDPPSNRLIVLAAPSDHKRLEGLLDVLDVPTETDEQQIKVFRLLYSDAQSMLEVLSMIVSGNDETHIAIDHRTNSLLVKGPEDSLRVIEAVLMKLDEEHTAGQPEKTFRVRIVWFTAQTAGDDALKSDGGLRDVVEELSKVGAGAMSPLGQTIIQVVPGEKFQISCLAPFDDGPAMVDIRGELDSVQPATHLNIDISAIREQSRGAEDESGGRRTRLVNLATEIIAPLGHFVVLGVTPAEERTLAFAVQVLPVE